MPQAAGDPAGCKWVIADGNDIATVTSAQWVGNLLVAPTPYTRFVLASVHGTYPQERNGRDWVCWTADDLTCQFRVRGAPPDRVCVSFEYCSPSNNRMVQMALTSESGRREGTIPLQQGWHTFRAGPLHMEGNTWDVRFHCDQPTVPIGTSRVRQVSYLIKNLRLEAVNTDEPDQTRSDLVGTWFAMQEARDGYPQERDRTGWWHWTEHTLSFDCQAHGPVPKRAVLSFRYMPVTDERPVRLEVGPGAAVLIRMKLGENAFRTDPIEIPGDRFTVRFTCDEPSVKLPGSDSRMASFLIKNLRIEPVEDQPAGK
jgi:hypothetical protein